MNFDKTKVNKILVIKPGTIGDVLLASPVAENLRHNFPGAEINFLTWSYCRDILTDNPFINRVLTYDIDKGDSWWCLIKNIHDQKYDLIIDLFCSPRTAVIVMNAEARYKVGYPLSWRRFAYNIKVKSRGGEVDSIEFNLDSLKALGLEIITNTPKFYINRVHQEFADNFFETSGLNNSGVIGINPCETLPAKVWSIEKYIELAKKLSAVHKILVFWEDSNGKSEAKKIKDALGERAVLIPEVNLKYIGALLKKCDAFITNDTGLMYLAGVLGVNNAAILGPSNPHIQGPLGENSVDMADLSVEDVYTKVMELFSLQKMAGTP